MIQESFHEEAVNKEKGKITHRTRFNEHRNRHPMKTHLQECQTDITEKEVTILHQTSKGVQFLETLEALYIRDIKPQLNTKDEWRRKELIIKL